MKETGNFLEMDAKKINREMKKIKTTREIKTKKTVEVKLVPVTVLILQLRVGKDVKAKQFVRLMFISLK